MDGREREHIAMRISIISIAVNVLLSGFKLVAGLLAHSGAMLSDAVHSLSDVLSTFVVIAGVRIARRDSDRGHPYGHERMECVAAILLSFLLFMTGLAIGWSGIEKMIGQAPLPTPGRLALVAAVVSVAVKEGMYRVTRRAAKRIQSSALMADAWHHRSDALSSIGSFAGILGARLGLPILDPVAGVVICLFIGKAAVDIFRDAIGRMTDQSCPEAEVERLRQAALAQDGVLGVDLLKTRLFGDRVYVDVEIRADGEASLREAHEVAQRTHDAIEREFPQVKHCMVHVNPAPEQKMKRQE